MKTRRTCCAVLAGNPCRCHCVPISNLLCVLELNISPQPVRQDRDHEQANWLHENRAARQRTARLKPIASARIGDLARAGRSHLHRRHPGSARHAHALGMSQAHARIRSITRCRARRVVAVFTEADIPGTNDCGPILHDDPIWPRASRICGTADLRRLTATTPARCARLSSIKELPAILTPQAAHAANLVLPPCTRRRDAQKAFERTHRASGQLYVGGRNSFTGRPDFYAIPKNKTVCWCCVRPSTDRNSTW